MYLPPTRTPEQQLILPAIHTVTRYVRLRHLHRLPIHLHHPQAAIVAVAAPAPVAAVAAAVLAVAINLILDKTRGISLHAFGAANARVF